MTSVSKYSAVLGRDPFVRRESEAGKAISAYGFPPLKRSFWRGLISEAHDTTVYFTAGMSAYSMMVPPEEARIYPSRIELMATCDGQVVAGDEDVVSAILLGVAEYVLDSNIFVGAGHTLDFQRPLTVNTKMSALFFTPPEGMDESRLRRCTNAEGILNVVPITAAELAVARSEGIEALVTRFEESRVRPIFDYARPSVV